MLLTLVRVLHITDTANITLWFAKDVVKRVRFAELFEYKI